MLAIEEQRATCNLPCVKKKCYFLHAGDFSTEHLQSSVSNVKNAVTAFLTVHGFARATIPRYDSKRHKAVVAQDRFAPKTCKLLVCQYTHCPRWVSPRVPSLKEASLVVIPSSVDNGGMIEIHVRYHRRRSSGIVKLRPITKARQMQNKRKRGNCASKRKRGKCSPDESEANAVQTKSRFSLATQD